MCIASRAAFHNRLGSMNFSKGKEALLRTHFPKCSEEIGIVLESKHGNYGLAYDELSGMNRLKKMNSEWSEAMARAEKITASYIEAVDRDSENLLEFWSSQWNDSYEGFCRVRDELANLREIVFHGHSERSSEREMFRKLLNIMIRSNAKEWFAVWGELDLHRLSPYHALETLNRCICTWMWDEVRIISGQRAHNGAHVSKGILFNLIHSVTGRTEPDATKFDKNRIKTINDTRKYIHDNGVEVFFYSDGGALYLRRSEDAQRDYLRNLKGNLRSPNLSRTSRLSRSARSSRLSRSSRRKSEWSEADWKNMRSSAVEKPVQSEKKRKQESRRKTICSAAWRSKSKRSPTSLRRSPRLCKVLNKDSRS
ncbi:hypothetical protein FGB62_178g023 [Gracilaria domingensis]|nr:hypothetical protein FGB62_178g023 [Gracilaria domingensis]